MTNPSHMISVKDSDGNHNRYAVTEGAIVAVKITNVPLYGYTADGYTVRNGAPTRYMVKLTGCKKWRRLYCICFSNSGSLVLHMRDAGKNVLAFVRDYEQPALLEASV